MKYVFFLFLTFHTCLSYGQEKEIKKPAYIIIMNDEIVTAEKVNQYARDGYIKGINKGVSDEEMERLIKKFGDKVGNEPMFIMTVTVYTEAEKKEQESKRETEAPDNTKMKIYDRTKISEEHILKINDTAKDFTVKMIDGKTIKLSDLKGKVVLLNFWATWCSPCIMEFYEIPSKIIQPFKNKEFVFLPISYGETKDKVLKKMLHLKGKGINFNVGFDPDKTISKKYVHSTIPNNFLIDQNGIIKYISTEYKEDGMDIIAKEIETLLQLK